MNRATIFILVNALFILAVIVGLTIHSDSDIHLLYLIALFAVCSIPILDTGAINGAYALLILFSIDYFLMYGALDFQRALLGLDTANSGQSTDSVFTAAESVILLGAVLVQVFYRVGCRYASGSRRRAPPKDWPELTLVVVGLVLWVVATRLAWEFTVHILTESGGAAEKRAFGTLSTAAISMYLIARMAQPLSILILAYAQARYRRPYLTPVVVGVVLFQLFFGFVIDTKSEALIGGILVGLTYLLTNGRIPKGWLAFTVAVLVVGFPLLQANRVVRGEIGENNTKASENVIETFTRAATAKAKISSGSERAQTALERLTLKGSVEVIVRGAGVVAPFQMGHTLSPLITAFVPRLAWADKPSVETGRLLNRAFKLSDAADTYMSPSHLGELYWNFGWVGVVIGMSVIGLLLGLLGAKFNLAEAATVTRLLVIVVTVRLLILAAEGELAVQYVTWMRSMLGIGLLHLALARRRPVTLAGRGTVLSTPEVTTAAPPAVTRP